MAELTATEQLEAMINGTHENDSSVDDKSVNDEEQIEETIVDEESAETEIETVEETSIEDTDLDTELEEEEDTEDENDGSDPETSETEEEVQEENAQVNDETSEERSDNTEEEQTGSDEDPIDYKEFYEKVALAKFTANGREVEGFKDPDDLVRAQQMLHGYSDKMKVIKEVKPFIKALQERGITSDPDKFNLAMSLLDGDSEAIKTVLKDKGIDPMELDLEDINYTSKNTLPTEAQLSLEDTYEQADNLGVGDKFNQVITKDWDVNSLQELINNGAVKNDLLKHLSDGTYDKVQTEIQKMELLDSTGALSNVNSIEKYRIAMSRLDKEKVNSAPVTKEAPVETPETPNVEEIKQKEEFKKKVEAKEKQVAENRKKAASLSKKKVVRKPKAKPKMEELKGDDFRRAFNDLLMN